MDSMRSDFQERRPDVLHVSKFLPYMYAHANGSIVACIKNYNGLKPYVMLKNIKKLTIAEAYSYKVIYNKYIKIIRTCKKWLPHWVYLRYISIEASMLYICMRI